MTPDPTGTTPTLTAETDPQWTSLAELQGRAALQSAARRPRSDPMAVIFPTTVMGMPVVALFIGWLRSNPTPETEAMGHWFAIGTLVVLVLWVAIRAIRGSR